MMAGDVSPVAMFGDQIKIHLGGNIKQLRVNGKFLWESNFLGVKVVTLGVSLSL